MRAYFQYSRRTHLKPDPSPCSALPAPCSPPIRYAVYYLGEFPLRFIQRTGVKLFEIASPATTATLFPTEDAAIEVAIAHGAQPCTIRPLLDFATQKPNTYQTPQHV
jgi:hypothetical protein